MTLPVAILAGGKSIRMRPITELIPKALIEIAGKPMIIRQLEYIHSQGITRVVLCLGYLGEMIEEVVGNGKSIGLKVMYSYDHPHLLGTGGALKKALPKLGHYFFVLYGDSFIMINCKSVEKYFFKAKKPALMTVLRNRGLFDISNAIYDKGNIIEYNKNSPRAEMEYVDYGLGVLSDAVFSEYPEGESFDLADVYQELSMRSLLAGYEASERFYEIGSYKGLAETIEFFKKDKGQ